MSSDDDGKRGKKRKAALSSGPSAADVVDLVATDEDAWEMTASAARALAKTVFEVMEQTWSEQGCLPHLKRDRDLYGFPPNSLVDMRLSEDRRGWFNYCVETIYMPQVLDGMRRKDDGHKQLHEVDFASLYSEMRQAKQCKEELLRMAKTTPGEFWPVTPRSAFKETPRWKARGQSASAMGFYVPRHPLLIRSAAGRPLRQRAKAVAHPSAVAWFSERW